MIKNYIGTAVVALGLLFSVGFAAPAQASSSLTSAQVSAILNLLQSFGADQSVINSVQVALGGSASGSLSCSNFTDLTYGDFDNNPGGRVSQLQSFLGISSNTFGFGTYGRKTQAAWNNMCGVQTTTSTQTTTQSPAPSTQPTPTTSQSSSTLIPSDTFVNFSVVQGASNPQSYNLHLTNNSSASVNFTLNVPNQPSWYNVGYNTQTMTLSPGGVMGVGVSVDATKVSSPGTYTANLIVSGNFSNSPITIPVTLTVTSSAQFQAQAPTVSYINPTSASVGATVYVYGTNFNNATFVGLDGAYGTAIQPSSMTIISPNALSFVVPSSLAVGTHSLGVAEKAGPWNLSSPVTLNVVAAQGTLTPSDSFVSFNVAQGQSNPSAYNLHLTNGSSASVNFTLNVPNQPSWYNVGYNTQTMTLNSGGVMGVGVSVDATKVNPGTYTANLIVSGNFSNSPITIPVTLVVTASQISTSAPTIDSFSVNGYSQVTNGKINVYNVTNPTVQWSSSNASYCRATSVEGISQAATTDFTGTQPTSGSQQLMFGNSYYNQREITLTCYNQNGVSSNTVDAWIGGKG